MNCILFKEICKALLAAAGGAGLNPETLFYVTGTWKALGNCAGVLPVANIVKVV